MTVGQPPGACRQRNLKRMLHTLRFAHCGYALIVWWQFPAGGGKRSFLYAAYVLTNLAALELSWRWPSHGLGRL